MTIRVFLVDDHSIVRQGLRALIDAEADMRVIGEASDAAGLTEAVVASGPEVVVMDVSMPGIGGAEATAQLKRALPTVRVVALTRHTEKAYVQQMVRSGASGYLLKQNGAAALIEAIRVVIAGGTYLDPAVAGKLVNGLTDASDGVNRAAASLTAREQQIATMVAFGHSNKEIATRLGIAVKTVETHKSNIMEKLDLTSRSELVRFALRQGWLEQSWHS